MRKYDFKNIEILVTYEPKLHYFIEWWKQLFGESEGKDKKGIYPSGAEFTTDLHSLGQYIQEGKRNIFETVINIKDCESDIIIHRDEDNLDELNYLTDKGLNFVNKKEDIIELKRLFFMTVQLRNKPDKDTDFILSPVQDGNGTFFDSRNVNSEAVPKLPDNGDANGAYNIARKGLLSIHKLTNGNSEGLSLEEWIQSVKTEAFHRANHT